VAKALTNPGLRQRVIPNKKKEDRLKAKEEILQALILSGISGPILVTDRPITEKEWTDFKYREYIRNDDGENL